jgi:stalled ribosome rescue protein Dom34
LLSYLELVRLERAVREQPVLSVYLDGTAEDFAVQHRWRTELDNAVKDLRDWLKGSSHNERETFDRCLAQLEHEIASFEHGIGSPGWAAFITGDGVRNAESLSVAVPTTAVWSTGASVAPYIRALKQARTVIVTLVDARQATLYRYRGGALEKLQTLRRHGIIEREGHMGRPAGPRFHAGTRGGTRRDEAQRELLEGTARLVREVAADALEYAGLDGWMIVGGIRGTASKIAQRLKAAAPDRVLHMESLDVHVTAAEIVAAARRGAATLRERRDLRRVDDIIESVEPNRFVAVGPGSSRHALEQFRVDELFLTDRFVQDNMASAEEAVRRAFDQGAVAEELSGAAGRRLDAFGGVAARLRYQLPQQDERLHELTNDGC